MKPLLEVQNLSKTYWVEKQPLKALHEVSFVIKKGETLGLVGESGCGKSTIARVLIGLTPPTQGNLLLDGTPIPLKRNLDLIRKMQMVFQDPYASLNPRMSIAEIIREPSQIHNLPINVDHFLDLVNLPTSAKERYPHQFSGGQRQRIAIARALCLSPNLLICDESLSALDASIQAQIAALLLRLQKELGLTYLFISHDLEMVRHVSTQIAVMYLGHFVEIGPSETIFNKPLHPYTQILLASAPLVSPIEEKKRNPITLKGELPSPLDPPKGCPFSTRCPKASAICHTTPPKLQIIDERQVACHLLFT